MNYLHNDKETFSDIVIATSQHTGIMPAIIEKDYFVTLLLKEIINRNSDIIFKGGTSLSKCHKIINRFSEDIDLGLNVDKATEGMRKALKQNIVDSISSLELELDNSDDVRSRRDFNRYQISYPISETTEFIKPYIYVETAVFFKPFPYEIKTVDSYIYRFLSDNSRADLIDEYSLQPFEVKVQTLERTFIDKLFALGDYYLTGKINGQSRHLYDLYKIMPQITFDDEFFGLFEEVRELRSNDSACPSAKPDQNLVKLLQEISDTDFYKSDYNSITKGLLFEDTAYKRVKENLDRIIKLFV